MSRLQERLRGLSMERLRGMRRGIEKESLRADANGQLAATPHPILLGSALTHPHITTDFSESQLEFITGVHAGVESCIAELTEIHQFSYRAIGDELLWVASMPCGLPTDETIPIGRYGTSNVGRAKSIYRMGLGHRYGRRMQTISGIHYNWSLPEVSSEQYFALIRNFRRHSFLLLYLFGASPAVCSSFVDGRAHPLQPLANHTLYRPHATSLRMGRLGYQSDAQASLSVSYNSLDSYAASLHDAMTRPYPAYEALGVRNPGGEYNQLATSLLQIENEFYGTIRPKRVIDTGERPLHALRDRGVEYVEVRCMDLDPFEPVGIGAPTARFLDIFLLHCLLSDSPPDSPDEIAALGRNQHRTAESGRQPGITLERNGHDVSLAEWGRQLLDECVPIAAALDAAGGGSAHRDALAVAMERLDAPDSTPSARVLAAMRDAHGGSHTGFTVARSRATREQILALPYSPALDERFQRLAAESIDTQKQHEAADTLPFEEFRQQYLSPEQLGVAVAA
ncbi:glutamate--cysteine ligase [Aquincola sp. S2]|uniref:Glutamate--cysteine ligase n=1 Tax=Pseudaquabacterium terrae TaxID=2732868 RepID=A0ABX2ED58_9BURK|nr:glutamate--cysteine ligase [Aquabacterium terrae]NRF65890.1 glutamate--cysteine ligase [Aquabacterium terrae]